LEAARQQWIVNFGVEDGSFIENSNTGKAERSRQRYELMREQSIAGGGSTGKKGGRVLHLNHVLPQLLEDAPRDGYTNPEA
jgi:hypothetical protein